MEEMICESKSNWRRNQRQRCAESSGELTALIAALANGVFVAGGLKKCGQTGETGGTSLPGFRVGKFPEK